jgi:RNA polymerase sigma factor (sigma-70 family)
MLPLDEGLVFSPKRPEPLLELDEALTRLTEYDNRASRIIELRFFGGLSVEETAEVLKISPRTVKREWRFGRAWLRTELGIDGSDGSKSVE